MSATDEVDGAHRESTEGDHSSLGYGPSSVTEGRVRVKAFECDQSYQGGLLPVDRCGPRAHMVPRVSPAIFSARGDLPMECMGLTVDP